jgi:cell wall-associated NlpC family hydrolase
MLDRQHIVDTARGWLGVPYRHQGRRKDKGVDCVGLIIGVGAELGLQ